jgi:NAD dependent epimerase/dehydratase family enzyme
MKDKKIIIPGGTGYIGQALAKYFGKDNHIIILGRKVTDHHNNAYNHKLIQAADGYRVQYINWDAKTVQPAWQQVMEGADIIINLAGRTVNCRYHKKNRQAMIDSRVLSTQAIGEAIRRTTVPPKLWINASSATIYKNSYDGPNDEFTGEISELKKDNMPYTFLDSLRYRKNKLLCSLRHGKDSAACRELDIDLSVKVCKEWEAAFFGQRTPFTRKVALRTAITLGEGGIIIPYLNLCKAALGGKHGSGKQEFSWVHIDDVCRMIEWLWDQKELEGVFNCVAPNAVTNAEFMSSLRKVTGHRIGLPAPVWMLELGAWLIGTETELMLKSRWVIPGRATKEGFRFRYETVEKAFDAIIAGLPRRKYHLF